MGSDTLFIGGCGRFFEGTPDEVRLSTLALIESILLTRYMMCQMHKALSYLGGLPDDTITYVGHEYTASNFKFAASVSPDLLEFRVFGVLDTVMHRSIQIMKI